MRTGIEQARIDLAKWEARVTEDETALAVAQRELEHCRSVLASSEKTAARLRDVVRLWDAAMASREQPNFVVAAESPDMAVLPADNTAR